MKLDARAIELSILTLEFVPFAQKFIVNKNDSRSKHENEI